MAHSEDSSSFVCGVFADIAVGAYRNVVDKLKCGSLGVAVTGFEEGAPEVQLVQPKVDNNIRVRRDSMQSSCSAPYTRLFPSVNVWWLRNDSIKQGPADGCHSDALQGSTFVKAFEARQVTRTRGLCSLEML